MNGEERRAGDGSGKTVRVAAIGDVHCTRKSKGTLESLFLQMAGEASVMVLCGDLTHLGLVEEARAFVEEIAPALERAAAVSVLGNHDFESGQQEAVWRILSDAGIVMLDGDTFEIGGVGFAGIKGFGGGFGKLKLHPWGEAAVKEFVREAEDEAAKLDAALSRLSHLQSRIAVIHYAPIRETVAGEPPELYAFLGSSHLEGVLDRHRPAAAFHGHAHFGSFEGQTGGGVPVYNVAMQVLKRQFPDRPPYLVLEFPAGLAAG
jgi:Icc-related predicted phosphoesterase